MFKELDGMPNDAAEEVQESAEETSEEVTDDLDGEFDPERALSTIRKQRENEKALRAQLAEARQAQEELAAIKAAEEEAQKTLEDKLAEKDAAIAALRSQIAERDVRASFDKEARARGIEDTGLAFLAAKEQGLLGEYNPKTGEVGEHNFDTLAELYPALAGEDPKGSDSGDAGIRRKSAAKDVNTLFNETIRSSVRARR